MQTATIVTAATLDTLNKYLEQGYEVVNMCGMPSSIAKGDGFDVASHVPTCLVILETP